MSFNAAATRLAVSSSNRTIHIFDVSGREGGGGNGFGGGGGSSGNERGRSGRISGRSSNSPRRESGALEAEGNLEPGERGSGVLIGGPSDNAPRRRGTGDGNADSIRGVSGRGNDSSSGYGSNGGGGSGSSSSGGGGGLASGFRSVVGMLPNRVTKRVQDYVDSSRSFASVRLRGSAGRSICALIPAGESGVWAGAGGQGAGMGAREEGGGNGSDHEGEGEGEEGEVLLVVTNEGILYSYAVDTIKGGECRLEQASSLLMDPGASQELGSEVFERERRAPPVLAGQG